jgi:hypothetical protein
MAFPNPLPSACNVGFWDHSINALTSAIGVVSGQSGLRREILMADMIGSDGFIAPAYSLLTFA